MDSGQIISNLEYGDQFGYSEMFEWGELVNPQISKICKFVQFSEKYPRAVILARNTNNMVGVTSMMTSHVASNPSEWPYKYLFNEYGDLFLEEKNIGVGEKTYDPINEFSYMSTYEKTIYIPVENPQYDKEKEYTKRSLRNEWVKVTILGKAIVEDNGECVPGQYCTLYSGDDKQLYGTAVPYSGDENVKFYVLSRLSTHTILIFISSKI